MVRIKGILMRFNEIDCSISFLLSSWQRDFHSGQQHSFPVIHSVGLDQCNLLKKSNKNLAGCMCITYLHWNNCVVYDSVCPLYTLMYHIQGLINTMWLFQELMEEVGMFSSTEVLLNGLAGEGYWRFNYMFYRTINPFNLQLTHNTVTYFVIHS